MERRRFLKNAAIAGGVFAALPSSLSFAAPANDEFPLLIRHEMDACFQRLTWV